MEMTALPGSPELGKIQVGDTTSSSLTNTRLIPAIDIVVIVRSIASHPV
jgi:hypothetical protein